MLQLITHAPPIAANSSRWIRTERIDLRITLPPLHVCQVLSLFIILIALIALQHVYEARHAPKGASTAAGRPRTRAACGRTGITGGGLERFGGSRNRSSGYGGGVSAGR